MPVEPVLPVPAATVMSAMPFAMSPVVTLTVMGASAGAMPFAPVTLALLSVMTVSFAAVAVCAV